MKSYTDLEQSKVLSEILPLESADMHYVLIDTDEDKYAVGLGKYIGILPHYPCWSLSALLGVLPEPYQLTSNKEGKVQLVLIHHLEKDYYDNPVDACVAIIEHLHELKML